MKDECDKNGLEYELMLQESAQARFLREVKKNNLDFGKSFILLKSKRENDANEPVVGAAEPEVKKIDPIVGAAAPVEEPVDPVIGNPISKKVNVVDNVITPAKILVILTKRLADARSKWESNRPTALPQIRTNIFPTVAPRKAVQFEAAAAIRSNLFGILGVTQAPDLIVQPQSTQ